MMKNKTNKLIVIIAVVSLVFSITGCSSSVFSNTKIEKLTFTEKNVEKVFSNQYNVRISDLNSERKSINVSFDTKTNIPKSKGKETLKSIEDTLNKKFDVNNKHNISINIYANDNILIEDNYGKIQIGEAPKIYVSTVYMYDTTYSMSKKFDLLNPFDAIKVTADDKEDGDITNKIKLKNTEAITKRGQHKLIYEIIDSDGNVTTDDELSINVKK
ncbi:MAG TPA: hypothetical protein VIM70_23190 [Clostridium sp.]|uniref:hypothetical protein n=1 Tax=Clostridium sp. TaxID=1506 RepID=UPI002F95F84F